MAYSRPPARARASGFVLAITLWLLAGMAVVVGLMTLWALDEVRTATGERIRVEDRLAMVSTRETVLYLAATRDLTLGGLPVRPLGDDERAMRLLDEFGAFRRDPLGDELRLDSRPYAGIGGTAFALQDEAGLFPVVWPQDADLDRFLEAQGAEEQQIPRLRDALLDYIDRDALRRLSGAEEREYRQAGQPAPPDRRLRLPDEALRVLGWSELPLETRDALADRVTTFYTGAVNLNTMPSGLLATWIPGCPDKCEALMLLRDRRPFSSSRDVQTLLAIRLPGDDLINYRYLASEYLRLTFWGHSGTAWRMHVRLTPLADEAAPWAVLAAYPVSRPSDAARAQSTDSDLFPDAAADRH
jgi:hypothetical protein